MTKADILAKVERQEIKVEEALALIEKLEKPTRKPPRFKVAEASGWCSVYFDGLRRPCTLPSILWLELLEAEHLENFRTFLKENKNSFRNK